MQCPLCHYEQAEGRVDCEACGLVFAKWKNKQAQKSTASTASEPIKSKDESPSRVEKGFTSVDGLRLYQRLGKLYIQNDSQEGLVYFPWGAVWKGFKVEDPERLARIERLETIFSSIHCPLVSILGLINVMFISFYPAQATGWFLFLILYLAVAYLIFGFLSTSVTWDLSFSKVKFNQKKFLIGFFKSFDLKLLMDLEVLALLLVLSWTWLLLSGSITILLVFTTPFVLKFWIWFFGILLILSTAYFYVWDGKLVIKKLLGGK